MFVNFHEDAPNLTGAFFFLSEVPPGQTVLASGKIRKTLKVQ